ncbi:MAG: molybdopterin-binding protein [Rhodobacteraceae bacterium]|nr:molybdopterin-binding protein [Paracoccaceae bacterium]
MKFGPVPISEAEGSILAHSVTADGTKFRKGQVLGAEEVAALRAAGTNELVVARLEEGDLHEDEAAAQLATALVPDAQAAGLRVTQPFTGRVNLIADAPGVVRLDVEALHRFNAIHPMITVATVPAFQQVGPGAMVATIKIISYSVPQADVARAAATAPAALRLTRPIYGSAGLVVTDIPGGPDNTKGIAAITARVESLGMDMAEVITVPHETPALAQALGRVKGDIALILTGSATSDLHDTAPEAVRRAGGAVDRFGMPVDPGNLLFIGQMGLRPVIGLPGCARSPALNGADWVLSRVACGVEVTSADISVMGVGGLLKEIPTRPQPRGLRPAKASQREAAGQKS